MNLRNLFRVSAVLFMIIGLVWLLAPTAMPASYGLDLEPYGAYILQQAGAINIAIAVLCFLVSGMAHSPARQAVVTFMLVNQVLSGIVTLLAVLGDVIPGGVGWLGVALNLVFALAFGYFRFRRPEISRTAEVHP
ncbi:MAG: hypothetical protein WA996_15065 [Candidatus Promineifilaceae bacterium]